MPRAKRKTEQAKPKQAEIISLASLRAKREAKRADSRVTAYVVTNEKANVDDIVLCGTIDGEYVLAHVATLTERGYTLNSNRPTGEITGVYGRVVMVEVTD
jgi:hypothetical protein